MWSSQERDQELAPQPYWIKVNTSKVTLSKLTKGAKKNYMYKTTNPWIRPLSCHFLIFTDSKLHFQNMPLPSGETADTVYPGRRTVQGERRLSLQQWQPNCVSPGWPWTRHWSFLHLSSVIYRGRNGTSIYLTERLWGLSKVSHRKH